MSNEKKEGGRTLRKRIACYCRQPEAADTLILRGRSRATVYGCRRILQYSPACIRLRVGKRTLAVFGGELVCSSFSGGALTVFGRIDAVRFEESAPREEDRV